MSDLSALMPLDPEPTLIGRDQYEIHPPSLLKWNAVTEVFREFGSVLPLLEVFSKFTQSGASPSDKLRDAVDSILKADLGEAIHAAARTLLSTKPNVQQYIDRLSTPEAQRAAKESKLLDAKGRWRGNRMFNDFVDDNLTTVQAFHTLATAARLTQAKDAVGKLLPFLVTEEAPAPSQE